jgi:hypothetical protein
VALARNRGVQPGQEGIRGRPAGRAQNAPWPDAIHTTMRIAPPPPTLLRRRLLGRALVLPLSPLLALAGCASTWPEVPAGPGSSSARARLREAADAHGLAAWQQLRDVNLGIDHLPWPAARGLQPGGPAQLRLLPATGAAALHGDAHDPGATPLAAALHRLLLLGPIALADFDGVVNWAEPVTLDGRRCDHLHLPLAPGLGGTVADRLSLFIDRDQLWLRRLQVSLTALDRAAVVTVDLAGHRRLHSVVWPLRLASAGGPALVGGPRPLAWQVTGLDVDRGYPAEAVRQWPWAGRASAPAAPLPPG